MAEITMPRLSDTMEEGTIGRWLKQPGDHIQQGDILAEIETDKATMELEAYESGTLQEILIPEGKTVTIGTIIAIIGDGAPVAQNGDGTSVDALTPQLSVERPHQHEYDDGEPIKASPIARRLAAQYGIDLRQIQGTGPGGRIIRENVEAFSQHSGEPSTPASPAPSKSAPVPVAAAPSPRPTPPPALAPTPAPVAAPRPTPPLAATPVAASSPPSGDAIPMSRMRRAIARAMTEAKPGYPHVYITTEVNMGAALELRAQINDSGDPPVKISINDMVVKAVAKALTKFPELNSSYGTTSDGQPAIIQYPHINVAVAISIDDGLVAPRILDTDKKSLGAIAAEIRDLVARARDGTIKQHELEGGTLTVSNLGMYDTVQFGAVITPPQAAIVAVGSVRRVPIVDGDAIVIGNMMHITLSSDHRITDGALAARYLQELKRLLQSPLSLLV